MEIVVSIIKAISFIVVNMAITYLVVWILKSFLLYPRELVIFNLKIPFTPGLLYRKKDWLINKLHKLLSDYLIFASTFSGEHNYIVNIEKQVYSHVWESLSGIENLHILPFSLKHKLRRALSTIPQKITQLVLRSLIPFLIDKLQIKGYIDQIDAKIDMNIINEYFNKYIYKYVLMATLALAFINGLINMILYLIVK